MDERVLTMLSEQLGRVESKVDTLVEKVSDHSPRIEHVEDDVRDVRKRVSRLETQLARYGGAVAVLAIGTPLAIRLLGL